MNETILLKRMISFCLLLLLGIIQYAHADPNSVRDHFLTFPKPTPPPPAEPLLQLILQDFEQLELRQSIIKTPLTIGTRTFKQGLGTHAISHVRIASPTPITHFSAWAGVDFNDRTRGRAGSVVFVLQSRGKALYRSKILIGGDEAERIDVTIPKTTLLDLHVEDAGDGAICDHADWADAAITLEDGRVMFLDEIKQGQIPGAEGGFPFSFVYRGTPSESLLSEWTVKEERKNLDADREKIIKTWTDSATGLQVEWQAIRYNDFAAAEWLLYFENTGKSDTALIENVQALDLLLGPPLDERGVYKLYKTLGGPANPADFEASTVYILKDKPQQLTAGQGRSSHSNFPFFKIDTKDAAYLFAIGWSGMWNADLTSQSDGRLRITAGLEKTHFVLHPGERVRSPRILILLDAPDSWEGNGRFRELVYKHYCAKRSGKTPEPAVFCNTCFTRGGGWLNECNAGNQISLIKSYAPLGLEALLTDAGWFEGGWPSGAGNWNPRQDAYPDGMRPVAQAAKDHNMIYGLWFEPERVVAGTGIHKEHPEWLLASRDEPEQTYLLNFGLPEVQEYFFNIVKGFMELPGFRFYRQDFNMDPLPYWRHSDAPDRVGISEMKYIEGLYQYWDRISETWPDSLREECASGGNRIDLETVMRMHMHQKTDYWFDYEVDQASLWGLSQYLPNNTAVAHLRDLDDYSFNSTMASSLCLGWITDDPKFDSRRGKELLDRYHKVNHLLTGAWYPLLPYSRDPYGWMAMQFHRKDQKEGMVLVFRRPSSLYRTSELSFQGLDPIAFYELTYEGSGEKKQVKGSDLMERFEVTLDKPRSSEMIRYKVQS